MFVEPENEIIWYTNTGTPLKHYKRIGEEWVNISKEEWIKTFGNKESQD